MKKTKKYWLIAAVVLLFGVVFFGIKAYINQPQDLGPGLKYIGRSDYGCLLICDSPPSSTYYFATAMTPDELKGYFQKASPIDRPNTNEPYQIPKRYTFQSNNKQWIITYYEDSSEIIKERDLQMTHKPYVAGMDKSTYPMAKAAIVTP